MSASGRFYADMRKLVILTELCWLLWMPHVGSLTPPDRAYCNSEFIISHNLPITIRSPNYPGSYPSRQRCTWKVRPMQPTARVRVTCTDVDLFGVRLGVPLGDFIRVTTAPRRRHVAINLDFLQCRSVPFYVEAEPGEAITIDFRSDAIFQRRGFSCQASIHNSNNARAAPRQCGVPPLSSSGQHQDSSTTTASTTSIDAPTEQDGAVSTGSTDNPTSTSGPVANSSPTSLPDSSTLNSDSVASSTESFLVDDLQEGVDEEVSPASNSAHHVILHEKDSQESDGWGWTTAEHIGTDLDTDEKGTYTLENLTSNTQPVFSSGVLPSVVNISQFEGAATFLETRRKKLKPPEVIDAIPASLENWDQTYIRLPPPSPSESWNLFSAEDEALLATDPVLHDDLPLEQDPTFSEEEGLRLLRIIKKYALTAMLRLIDNGTNINLDEVSAGRQQESTDESSKRTGKRTTMKIVNGEEASPHEFPWAVFLRISANGNDGVVCGGSLISSGYVLTAAHCVEHADSVQVLLGYHHLDRPSALSMKVGASEKVVHPAWSVRTVEHDIALLKLDRNVTFNDHVQPICLPARSQISDSFSGSVATVVGWGGFGVVPQLSRVLRYASAPVMSNCRCQMRWMHLVTPLKMCLSGRQAVSPCGGDSGGLLQVTSDSGHAVQVGVVSWGTSLGCDAGWPSGHTRVTAYLDWIEENSDVVIAM